MAKATSDASGPFGVKPSISVPRLVAHLVRSQRRATGERQTRRTRTQIPNPISTSGPQQHDAIPVRKPALEARICRHTTVCCNPTNRDRNESHRSGRATRLPDQKAGTAGPPGEDQFDFVHDFESSQQKNANIILYVKVDDSLVVRRSDDAAENPLVGMGVEIQDRRRTGQGCS